MAINIDKLKEIIKANNLTAEMLGVKPSKDPELIRQMRHLIEHFADPMDARDYISQEYWKDLGIEEKKYRIVKCDLSKT